MISKGELIRRRESILNKMRYRFNEVDLIDKMRPSEFEDYKEICTLLKISVGG